jgi:hypothetical protein
MRWRYEEADIAPGRAIVAVFKPFLLDLLHRKVSKTTFNRDSPLGRFARLSS